MVEDLIFAPKELECFYVWILIFNWQAVVGIDKTDQSAVWSSESSNSFCHKEKVRYFIVWIVQKLAWGCYSLLQLS